MTCRRDRMPYERSRSASSTARLRSLESKNRCVQLHAQSCLTVRRPPCFIVSGCATVPSRRSGGVCSASLHGGGCVVPAARPSQSRLAFLIVAISVLTVMAAAPAAAQILYGSVVGAVRDSSGAVMPGATVMIVNKENNLTLETTTKSDGAYSIINVQPGPYDIKVTLPGFRDVARYNVPVTIGQIARVDVTMEVGAVSETVLVIGESPLLQTDKSDVHTQIRSTEITSMPLNRYRNFQGLLNLAPGTTPLAFGNAETDTP